MKRILVISLYPVSATGGGESYTLNCAKALSLENECDLIAPIERGFIADRSLTRFQRLFNINTLIKANVCEIEQRSYQEILKKIGFYDVVFIHQYLAGISVHDMMLLTHSDQTIIFTNLGFEENSFDFWIRYTNLPNHFFIEISEYSANRTKKNTNNVGYVYAGAWKEQLKDISLKKNVEKNKFISVGRLLPHKAFEIMIEALNKNEALMLVGPYGENDHYQDYLKAKSHGKNVYFTGEILASERDAAINSSIALIANSSSTTYQNRIFEQSELLGLVIIDALINNTLPITSSQPALKEVMEVLNLENLVYEERDSKCLRNVLDAIICLSDIEYYKLIEQAKIVIENKFLWDDYWQHIGNQINFILDSKQLNIKS